MKFNLKSLLGSVDFGRVTDDRFRTTLFGTAVKQKDGSYVVYDPKEGSLKNVDIASENILAGGHFKVPCFKPEIGDLILHQNEPCYVTKTAKNSIQALNVTRGEIISIVPNISVMGSMLAYSKIVSLFNAMGIANPFAGGNGTAGFNPMMLALLGGDEGGLFGGDGNEDDSLSSLLMLQMLGGGNAGGNFGGINPLMLLMLDKTGGLGNDNLFTSVIMMQALSGNANSAGLDLSKMFGFPAAAKEEEKK